MPSIIIIISLAFLTALLLSLLLTPVIAKLGLRLGALDRPNARKVHTKAIPRIGGLAIIAAFFLTRLIFLIAGEYFDYFSVRWDLIFVFWIGAAFAAGIGIVDDFKRIPSPVKLTMQVLAATAVFLGGVRIESFGLLQMNWHFSLVTSYLLTIFWFVLLMNAINLIDGLDGLAAGVVVFAASVMTVLMFMGDNIKGALGFAVLAGSTLGFLRYNFNPAKIFMGDGGSYFLGYALAFLSIRYGAKSQMGLSLLIPLIALGVPIFDVIISPIRRFIIGQRIFKADKGHVHHRLLAMGLTTKRAVIVLYMASSVLALSSLLLVNLRSEQAGIIFFILGIAAVLFVRKLGYFEYFALEKIFGWLHDIRDVSGLTRSRRAFLGVEIDIRESRNVEEMWRHVCVALEMKNIHKAYLILNDGLAVSTIQQQNPFQLYSVRNVENTGHVHMDGRKMLRYTAKEYQEIDIAAQWKFDMTIPLIGKNDRSLGFLYLIKDLQKSPLSAYTIRRLESLRRSVIIALEKLDELKASDEQVSENSMGAGIIKKKVSALTRFFS